MAATQNDLVKGYAKTLAAVPVAEMPAKAASLAAKAKPQEQVTNAVAVLRAAVQVSPASTVLAVSAICGAPPAAAPAVAAEATKLEPALAGAIAKAAAAAAPAFSQEIAAAVQVVIASANSSELAVAKERGLKAPIVAPPYTPGGATPGEIKGGQSGEIPAGGVRYSSP
jgi:hypothetical protein